ncbi:MULTISPECIES: response regulator [Pseudomonas]|uniref:Response regulator n=1 Tax=Pseudomonas azadiae TaxID=2843612 RepID=A0ABS6NTC6_9PSED|nr:MULTISPECIES: response regulator [Pseudomonas]MBV4451067.1 response regulator [Pseudomonas azadiae]NMF40312.1 response regulator [Pseudomonas sp. SWRI 103]
MPGNATGDDSSHSTADTPDSWQQARVLVIDDHALYRSFMGVLLDALGVRHAAFNDAPSALQALARERFDLVISDCRMPVMDGYAMTRELRRMERDAGLARVPVIALTGRVGPKEIRRCVECGMDGWLLKPIGLEQLRDVLCDWLPMPTPAPGRGLNTSAPRPQGFATRDSLIATFGAWEVVEPLLYKLIQGAHEDLDGLLHARTGEDEKSTTQHLHRLVGSVAFLGATTLEQRAVRLIDRVHQTGVAANRTALERICQDIERYLEYLRTL